MSYIIQPIDLNLVPKFHGVPLINVKQFDSATRQIKCSIYNKGDRVTNLATNATLTAKRPDGTLTEVDCTYEIDNTINFDCTKQLTILSGKVFCSIIWVDSNGDRISTEVFIIDVQEHPMQSDESITEEEESIIETWDTKIAELNAKIETKIEGVKLLYGTQDNKIDYANNSSQDLNNIIAVGEYWFTMYNYNLPNLPDAFKRTSDDGNYSTASRLTVEGSADKDESDVYVWQTITGNNGYPIYRRAYNDGTWSDWKEISNTDTSFKIKSLNNFKFLKYWIMESTRQYIEAMATDGRYLYMCAYNYADISNRKTIVYKVQLSDYSIVGTYSYDISIINSCGYSNGFLYLKTYSISDAMHKIRVSDMSYIGTVNVDDKKRDADPISGKACSLDISDNTFYVKIYDDIEDTTPIKEYEFALTDEDVPAQGYCFYNNHIYQLTWNGIIEMNLLTESINITRRESNYEFEGMCSIDDTLYFIGHYNGGNGFEILYKYTEAHMDENVGNEECATIDGDGVNLNFLLGSAKWYITNGTSDLNFPSGFTAGIVWCDMLMDDSLNMLKVTQHFKPVSSEYNLYSSEYIREYDCSTNTWLAWKPSTTAFSGTATIDENGIARFYTKAIIGQYLFVVYRDDYYSDTYNGLFYICFEDNPESHKYGKIYSNQVTIDACYRGQININVNNTALSGEKLHLSLIPIG